MLLNNGTVRIDDGVKRVLAEFKDGVGIAVIQIVKEDAAETTGFATVRDDKVAVGPGLEFGIELGIMLYRIPPCMCRGNASCRPR